MTNAEIGEKVCLFLFVLYSAYDKAITAAEGSVNLFSNHLWLWVYGICGHFLGV